MTLYLHWSRVYKGQTGVECFGCFVFEFWVLRASVFVFECFVFETTQPGTFFQNTRYPAFRNFEQFSRNSSFNSSNNIRYLLRNLKRL